jgi:hypothetical protein
MPVISRINILVCLIILALMSTACQFIAPAAPTLTAAATDTPAAAPTDTPAAAATVPAANAYPEPYPLLPTYDPYLPPVLPDPYAYPAQGAPLAPGAADILYPGALDGTEVYWVQAVSMILNGEVTQVMQTHDLEVYLTLKDGRTLLAIEPEIDDVMKVIQSCGDPCKNILVATE